MLKAVRRQLRSVAMLAVAGLPAGGARFEIELANGK